MECLNAVLGEYPGSKLLKIGLRADFCYVNFCLGYNWILLRIETNELANIMKIGFFDSGLGGLTILKATAKELPDYDYLYYGDTENLPYGDKTESEIYAHTTKGVAYLFDKGCALVILACNTASAETARKLQREFIPSEYPDRKVLGIIVPTVEAVSGEPASSAILIATRRTVESKKYQIELNQKTTSTISLTSIATPQLVPLIELNELEAASHEAIRVIQAKAGESEVVILGCTHYTQIKQQLRDHFGESKKIISQDEVIPEKLRLYLEAHPEITETLTRGGSRNIHLTRHRPDYDTFMGQLLGGIYLAE